MYRYFGVFIILLLGSSCSLLTDSTDNDIPIPLSEATAFQLYPNDSAANDSAAKWLSQGVLLRVHPQALYTLVFDTVAHTRPPKMYLYRMVDSQKKGYWNPVKMKQVLAQQVGERWQYDFECQETEATRWSVVLADGSDYWNGPVRGLNLSGQGEFNEHFSVNLIVAGHFGGFSDAVSIDSAAKMLLAGFRTQLAGSGIIVDTVTVRLASAHPTLGAAYPDNRQIQGSYSDQGLSTDVLGGWPEAALYGSLDIVLIRQFVWDGVLGLSTLFGGSLGGGPGSTVATATHYMNYGKEIQVDSKDWVYTAIHESGHFFGLRHTTSTTADLVNSNDASIIEDGFADTPVCKAVLKADLPNYFTARIIAMAGSSLEKCPDARNLMFPYSFDGVSQNQLSASQLLLWKRNLQIMEH